MLTVRIAYFFKNFTIKYAVSCYVCLMKQTKSVIFSLMRLQIPSKTVKMHAKLVEA
jgi:hypothetical protein